LIDSVKDKEPTQAHKALADLQIPIITMNIDCLHQKAGSRVVLQIHGDYKNNNVVLYGEDIHYREESINLIIQTAKQAKAENDKAILLVIGTSMQTVFANILTEIAKQYGMQVHYINSNADQEVPTFLKTHVILHK
jgi:NAD-dependent deacetylase